MIKTGKELAEACVSAAKNHKTLYIKGCFGSPMTEVNKSRYQKNNVYNAKAARKAKIQAATADTFGFDCVCLIKGLLWGWRGDTSRTYGGAVYASNGVPDIGTEQIIKKCHGVSTDFTDIAVGELLWKTGHVGIYIGDGLAVECTPSWADGVQVTAVANLGQKAGYQSRKWTKHGRLPYVSYEEQGPPAAQLQPDYAKSKTASLAGSYSVRALGRGLNLRAGASSRKPVITVLPEGATFRCYGYHTGSWLYGVSDSGHTGFCWRPYLQRK